jgi:nicotinamide mononucleotide (NMN) deamidase PncC
MKKFYLFNLLLIMAVSIFVSCKTTDTGRLTEIMDKARAARQRAIDFESPAYFPSEWEKIEEQYQAALEMPTTKANEIQLAEEAFNTAADAYDELFGKTIPLYAQAREDEILSARDALISSGFTEYFPDFLKNADDLALAAKEQYEAKEFYEARDTVAKALEEYETLQLGARVFLTREEIIERGFLDYDRENFARADDVTKKAIEEYEAGNKETAITNAEEALLRYNLVLATGWTAYAGDKHTAAGSERELALTERANIASREIFREAESFFNQAEESFKAERFHEAALHFTDAEAMFAISRQDTAERRQRAEAAIRLAEESIEERVETAIEAERIIEGGLR